MIKALIPWDVKVPFAYNCIAKFLLSIGSIISPGVKSYYYSGYGAIQRKILPLSGIYFYKGNNTVDKFSHDMPYYELCGC